MVTENDTPGFVQRPVDYWGRSIGPLRLARAMFVNILGGCCIQAAVAVLWPTAALTIIFLKEHLSASKTDVGLNLTLVMLATLAALPGAWLFSRLRERRRFWVAVAASARMFMFGPVVVTLLAGESQWSRSLFWVFSLSLLVVQGGSVFASAGWWAWMGELIPETIRGAFFGRRFKWMLLSQSAASLIAGLLIDRAGDPQTERVLFFIIFSLAAVFAVVDPLLFWFVPEPARPAPPHQKLKEVARQYLAPLQDGPFRIMLLGTGVYGFSTGLPMVFLILFLRGEQAGDAWIGGRASLGFLSLMAVASAVATAVGSNPWGRLADKIGHRTVWVLCSIAYFAHSAFFFVNEYNYQWLAMVFAVGYGLLSSGQLVAAQNMALCMAPPNRREYYVSMFQVVGAVCGALGPILGGWLSDHYRVSETIVLPSGQPASYIHLLLLVAFVGILAVLPLMVRVPDIKGTTVLPWVGRMLSGDLLRTLWNISVLATAASGVRRVRALRRINHRDGNLMLWEIIAALDDYDPAVRREALLALGRLGTPEALDLLLWHLHDPDVALRAPSIEAIGRSEMPDRVSLLRRALRDTDGRVRRAAAEALGHSGDRDAAEELRSLLASEKDGEVLVSVAVALSRLREFGGVREMLDLALRSDNKTVRSQMVVALADLLGGAAGFPKLWRQDRQWRGTGFAAISRRLKRQARAMLRVACLHFPIARSNRRELIRQFDREVEQLLEHVEAEFWPGALGSLKQLTLQTLRLRYGYEGDDEHALEFISAVSPTDAERYWLVSYLHHVASGGGSSEASWDGLTLMALHVLLNGHPTEG